MAAKKATERIQRYKDADGMYLDVDERDYSIRIGWFDPNEGDFGLMLANEQIPGDGASDTNLASEVCKAYLLERGLHLPGVRQDYEFDSARQAKECLRLINAKLHYAKQKKPLPDWAEKALAAGWSPPKGWKP